MIDLINDPVYPKIYNESNKAYVFQENKGVKHKIMASLDDQKISLEPCLLPLCPYNFISYDLENRSKCCLKTLKNGQNGAQNGPENPENGTKKWLDTLI